MDGKKEFKGFSLTDQADRDAATHDLERSICVEAGAGTGKTTLLVERIISLLQAKRAALEQIVAITFTEKAAGELKVRLREALERAIPKARGDESEPLIQALRDLERAPISTIHSFCASLLKERPVEARVDPNFEPLDEMGIDILFKEAWDQWLGEEMEKKSGALRRALALGLNLDSMAKLVRLIYDNRDLIPPSPFPRPSYAVDKFMESLERGVLEAWELARSGCQKEEDLGFQNIQFLREKMTELKGAPEGRKEIIIFRELEIKVQGNKQNWKPPSSCQAQKEICKKLGEELGGLKESIRAVVMADLVEWLGGFLTMIQDKKARQGVLDFQDLLLFARDLLRNHKEVRKYFQEKFKYILVDEFQDTDPLQVEVVFFLVEDGAQADRWEKVVDVPGKLFLVGDPKQSIYRFRRADIEIYQEAKEKLSARGGDLKAVQNFRTVSSIIAWVNQIFGELIQASPEGHFQPAYIPLAPHPHRKEVVADQPGVILLVPPPDFDAQEASVQRSREAEAQSIAALIEEMVAERLRGRWMVFDKKERQSRPMSYRDMALLFPTLTGVEAYEEALKIRGIPYRLEGGKEFYLRQEVRSLLSCLQALDDPADEISLVAALRSPFFGFSDEEIFLFVSSGNRLNYLFPPEEEGSDFFEAFALLRRLHRERNSGRLSSPIIELLSKTKALEFSLLRQGGEQVAANLRKIIEQARAFAGGRQVTFRRFVEWLETREEEGVREGESPWSEEGEENVKLLTVHKAKGLEFPAVFLANLAGRRQRTREFIPLRLQQTFQIALGQFKTLGYDSAWEREQAKMEAEERRLLYVATTRARDHLVIPLFWSKRGKGYFDLLEGRLPNREKMKPGSIVDGQLIVGAGELDLQPGEKPPLRLELGEHREEKDSPLQRRIQWKEALNLIKEKASRGLPLLAPSLSDEDFQPAASGKGGGGAAFGLAFHGVMEGLDLINGRNLKSLCQEKAKEQGIPGMAEEIEMLCSRCLDHSLIKRVRKSKRFFREVPFSVSLGGNLVEGKLDLLFEEDGGWVILDYKTDEVSGDALEQRFHSYREQGAWYAEAVRKATRGKVKEMAFFFVRAGEVRIVERNGQPLSR